MSGQESIRGYLFQSLIAVLKSLNGDWNSICVEPKTEYDKVDIIWTFTDQSIEVSQVKSSINNFSTNDIFKWLQNLTLDYNDAKIYSIYLVGNSSKSTKSLFNSIKDKPETAFPEKFKSLFRIKDRLRVFFEPNNIETLESALIADVDKFFFSKEILTDYPTKKLIANGMVNQIIKISTLGKVVHKSEFESHLLDWILYNYSEQVTLNKANFELQFYHNNKFLKTLSDVKITDLKTSNLFISKKRKVEELYRKISKYDFPVKTFEKEFDINDLSTLSSFKSSFEYSNEPVIINSYEIKVITKGLKKILNVKPEKEFFNFGELKETKTMSLGFPLTSNKTTLIGSEIEKEKKKLYQDIYWEINEILDLMNFWEKLSKLSILPIVITNIGKQHNEEIRVQLSVPENIKVIKSTKIPIPRMFQNLEDLNSHNSFLFKSLKQNQNSVVNEYYPRNIMPQFINFGMFGYERKGQEEDKFRSMLNYYFEYNYYYDKPNQTIIECDFKELNTNESMAFPTYILVKSHTDFTIEYEITCKNEPEKITGTLEYKASS
mgnify:CR=1 FL=1